MNFDPLEIVAYERQLDAVYFERNHLVALLARLFPSGLAKTNLEGWDPTWHNCVYIDLPTGQVSWHFHERELALFADLPPYEKAWDGHTTAEKYARVRACTEKYGTPKTNSSKASPMSGAKQYLGDGVYAEMVERTVKLTTENGVETTNTIYLEQETVNALIKYLGFEE